MRILFVVFFKNNFRSDIPMAFRGSIMTSFIKVKEKPMSVPTTDVLCLKIILVRKCVFGLKNIHVFIYAF